MKKTAPPFSFRIDPEVRDDLEKFAAKDDRSLSNYINKVLRDHVASQKKKR